MYVFNIWIGFIISSCFLVPISPVASDHTQVSFSGLYTVATCVVYRGLDTETGIIFSSYKNLKDVHISG